MKAPNPSHQKVIINFPDSDDQAKANERWAKYSGIGITCLDQNPVEMGRAAARVLLARIYDGYDGPYELKEMPARLCAFASTEA